MSKKVLFACLHRPGRSPSQRYRFEQYIPYLEANGFECHHSYLLNAADDHIFYQEGYLFRKGWIVLKSVFKRLAEVLFKKYDIVYVQREAFMLGTSFFERRYPGKLIFDFDDAIWMHQTGDARSGNKAFYFLKRPSKTKVIIANSNLVIAGNKYLAEYANRYNQNVRIIPSTVDTEQYQRNVPDHKPKGKVCIGWSGSFSTIGHFELAIPALLEIRRKYGEKVYFKVFGDGRYENEELGIKGVAWNAETEVREISEMDIGVMPLPDDEWTKGKCGMKALLYMALEIPAVVSPVGTNKVIINDGQNGLFADNTEQWVEKLSRLIENPSERQIIGNAGRKTVEEKYSVKANREKYLSAFQDLDRR